MKRNLKEKVISVLDEIKENKYVVGTKQTLKAVETGSALKVFLAEDASDYMKNSVIQTCEANNTPIEEVGTMHELGNSCGICRGAVTAAIIKKS